MFQIKMYLYIFRSEAEIVGIFLELFHGSSVSQIKT